MRPISLVVEHLPPKEKVARSSRVWVEFLPFFGLQHKQSLSMRSSKAAGRILGDNVVIIDFLLLW